MNTFVTTDLSTALANNYIGEVCLTPKELASALHLAFHGRKLASATVYYYGELTEELAELFGYH